MTRYVVDIETTSECDLTACVAWVYAEHPTTRLLCIAWCDANSRTVDKIGRAHV